MTANQPVEITNKIRTLRFFAREMTQQQLAEKVGVSRQTIVSIEKGRVRPITFVGFSYSKSV